jgi:hypothetical protein
VIFREVVILHMKVTLVTVTWSLSFVFRICELHFTGCFITSMSFQNVFVSSDLHICLNTQSAFLLYGLCDSLASFSHVHACSCPLVNKVYSVVHCFMCLSCVSKSTFSSTAVRIVSEPHRIRSLKQLSVSADLSCFLYEI